MKPCILFTESADIWLNVRAPSTMNMWVDKLPLSPSSLSMGFCSNLPTRIIWTWTPSWKKDQIWGATSSQAFPIVLSLSSSSNVVLAYKRDGNVCVCACVCLCVRVFSCPCPCPCPCACVCVCVCGWLVYQGWKDRKLLSKINTFAHKCQYLGARQLEI